jgi:hypothetical protein
MDDVVFGEVLNKLTAIQSEQQPMEQLEFLL